MSWNKLAPIAKTNGRPMASASIVVNKDGVAKISLILSASLKDEFGDPQRCDISAGEGEDAGSILVEFADDGAFDVKNFVHGGARLFLPLIAGCPEKAVANAPCALGAKIGVGPEALAEGQRPSVVIALPLAAWRGNIDTRMTPAVRPAPTLPASPPPRTQGRQRPAARHGRVPVRPRRDHRAAGEQPLPGERRTDARRPGAEAGQRSPQGSRSRSAPRGQGVVRAR